MKHIKRAFRIVLVAAALTVTCILTTAFAAEMQGTTTDSLRLREEPNTQCKVLAKAPKGVQVTVLEDNGDGWYKATYKGLTGYMSADYIVLQDASAAEAAAPAEATCYVSTWETVNIRAGAGTDFDKVGKLRPGAKADLLDQSIEGWYKISYNGLEGYVSADYCRLVDAATVTLGEEIVNYAMQFKGCPYVYGAAGPKKFDCSGLTKYVYAQFGYTLSRSANDQYYNGTKIDKSELQLGDLVLFKSGNSSKAATHVGIYIGDDQFIHASSSSVGVVISDLDSNYYTKVYVGARRVI